MKKACIECLQGVTKSFQEVSAMFKAYLPFQESFTDSLHLVKRRAQVTDDLVRQFMDPSRKIDPSVNRST